VLHLTAYSLRFAALRSGFRQQVSLGVRLEGGDTFNINLCDTDDKCGDVMTVRK
jgi:hypothetical protein